MPAAATDFRVVCGSFVPVFQAFMKKRALEKMKMNIRLLYLRTRTQGVLFGAVLSYLMWGSLLMLRSGDVERNPGPGPEGDGSVKTTAILKQSKITTRSGSSDKGAGNGDKRTPQRFAPQNLSLADVMAKLNGMDNSMNGKLDEVKGDVRDIKDKFSVLEGEVKTLKQEMKALRQENDQTKQCNSVLRDRVESLEKKVDDLEGRSKRNNLLFYGLEREEGETNESCEMRLKELFIDNLDMTQDVQFDRVHRLSSKPNSPLIARCTYYKDKVNILKAKSKLKGTNIYIGEDFSRGVREIRQVLYKFMQEKRKMGHRVSMVYDHLFIDGEKFFLSDQGHLVKSK